MWRVLGESVLLGKCQSRREVKQQHGQHLVLVAAALLPARLEVIKIAEAMIL
jgi:hypothetical protein